MQHRAEVSEFFTELTMADVVTILIMNVNRLLNCIRYRCFIKKLICGLSQVYSTQNKEGPKLIDSYVEMGPSLTDCKCIV